MGAYKKIILALDRVWHWDRALEIIDQLCNTPNGPLIGAVKLHMLIDHYGLAIVRNMPVPVMVDMKFCDTPDTVAERTMVYAPFCDLLTVSALRRDGEARVRVAVQAVKGTTAKILAVGSLTSDEEMEPIVETAHKALRADAHGIVCAGSDLGRLASNTMFNNLIRVVPGIRLSSRSNDCHKRTSTPELMMRSVTEHDIRIVVGRSVLQPDNLPATIENLKTIIADMESANV